MKNLNKKYIAMLLFLSVGQSSHMLSSFNAANVDSCSDSESYVDAGYEFSPETFQMMGKSLLQENNSGSEFDSESDSDAQTQYSFIESQDNFIQDGCESSQENQPEHQDWGHFVDTNSENDESDQDDDEIAPHNITEFNNDASTLEDKALPDITTAEVGSEHERRSVGSQIIDEAHRDLKKSNSKLNKVENQMKELAQRSEKAITNSAQYIKKQLNEDRIQENFDIATAQFATAIKQIDVLAKSTDKVIQKEFKAAQDGLMKSLEKTEQKLRKVSNKMDQQFKKLGKSTQRLFKTK